MTKRLIKNIFGILFLPLLFSLTKSFYLKLIGIETLTEASRYFLFGIVAYILMYILFLRMDYLYILGHEFMHVLCVWFCGGRVLSFNIRKTGGSITATKSNIFIDLVPYTAPIYTILTALAYLIGSAFWEIDVSLGYFIFLIGFSFSFHIVMTIDKVRIKQPDFLKLGYVNSLVLIYIVNVIIVSLFFGFLFPDFSFKSFIDTFFADTKELYTNIFGQLFQI